MQLLPARRGVLGIALFVSILGITCSETEDDGPCLTSAELRQALQDARPGDTVRVGSGVFEGNFTVPAGVYLLGGVVLQGPSRLRFLGDSPVLDLPTEDGLNTRIENLLIEGGPGGGLQAKGKGDLLLVNLGISVTGWLAVHAAGLKSVTVQGLELNGNVTAADLDQIGGAPDGSRYALAGLAAVGVGQAIFDNLKVQGFAAYGVLLVETPARFNRGEINNLVGTGIQAVGPVEVSLFETWIHHIWQGASPYGYGIVASDRTHLVTTDVPIEDIAVVGLLMDHATGAHSGIQVKRAGRRGIWLQHCQPDDRLPDTNSVRFFGTGNHLDDNSGVALGIYQSLGVRLSGGQITATSKINMPTLLGGSAEIGDGLVIVGSDDLEFSDLTIHDNARAGVVVDGTGNPEGITRVSFSNVVVSGDGTRGFVEQNGTATSAPDVITPALQEADASGGSVRVVAGVGAEEIPLPENLIDIHILPTEDGQDGADGEAGDGGRDAGDQADGSDNDGGIDPDGTDDGGFHSDGEDAGSVDGGEGDGNHPDGDAGITDGQETPDGN